MAITLLLLIVGGLFMLGYGIFTLRSAEQRHGPRSRPGRTRANDGDRGVLPWLMADTALHHSSLTDHAPGASPHSDSSDHHCGHASAHGDSASDCGGYHDCGGSDCGGGDGGSSD